jgi:hypothetical protein
VRIEREIRAVIKAIKEGLHTPSMKGSCLRSRPQTGASCEGEANSGAEPSASPEARGPLPTASRPPARRAAPAGTPLGKPSKRFAGSSMRCASYPMTGGWRSSCSETWRSAQAPKSPSRRAATGCR